MIEHINLSNIKPEDQTEELCILAVSQSAAQLQFVANPTENIYLAAVKKDGNMLINIKNPSHEVCLAAITQDGGAIKYMKEQTEELCLAAVNSDGWNLMYIENPSNEVCLAAVGNYSPALRNIKNKTPEICLAAAKNNNNPRVSLLYFPFLSDEIILYKSDYFKMRVSNSNIYDFSHEKNLSGGILFNRIKFWENNDKLLFYNFIDNPIKYLAEVISEQSLEYIVELKNKASDIFENSIDLMSVYEKALLNKNIDAETNFASQPKPKKL